ncbi:glycerophosphodiester phosphodiesterase family protein [Pelagibacterium montanilacus]|uniref:glycerophosphodiester phosphodiesterase family protein n=1 Tax=Pelagibacterium montanilacus TaxID=2185280 RepID=UPI000F8E4226|nr:glycerophosphodiester phosphodiesterase family protein [Pelagibacterium montanilacus]
MHDALFARPIAHRGRHDRAMGVIENSASAFAGAMERGFAIECDLQLTADGVPIVFHDDDLERLTARTGPVRGIEAAALGAMPLEGSASGDCPQAFPAFLDQVAGRVPLIVELKAQADSQGTTALAERAVRMAEDYQGLLGFKSFDPALLLAVRRAGFAGPCGIVTYAYRTPEWDTALTDAQRFVRRHLLHWPLTRFTFISCAHQDITLPMVRLCRRMGLVVMTWTVRDTDTAHSALAHADQIVFEGFDPET